MNRLAIFVLKYYLNDKQLDFTDLNDIKSNTNFSDIDILEKKLDGINTRLVDRQSMALAAAIRPIDNDENYKKIDKSSISVVVGSLSAAVYPIFEYFLSSLESGPNFVNPSFFPNTVANAPASRLCIWNQFKNRVICLSQGKSSGLDAIMMASEQINDGFSKYFWAGASEENGASLMLIGNEINSNWTPIAYVKNYESRYIGGLQEDQKEAFINQKISEWDLNKCRLEKIKSKDSALFSLEPMIDIGKALIKISKNEADSAIIISCDDMGILSIIEIGSN